MGLVSSLTKAQQKALLARLRAAGRSIPTLADIAIVTGASTPKPRSSASRTMSPTDKLRDAWFAEEDWESTPEGVGVGLLESEGIISLTLRPGLVLGAFSWTLKRRVEGGASQYMHGRITRLEDLYEAMGLAHLAGNWRRDKFPSS